MFKTKLSNPTTYISWKQALFFLVGAYFSSNYVEPEYGVLGLMFVWYVYLVFIDFMVSSLCFSLTQTILKIIPTLDKEVQILLSEQIKSTIENVVNNNNSSRIYQSYVTILKIKAELFSRKSISTNQLFELIEAQKV